MSSTFFVDERLSSRLATYTGVLVSGLHETPVRVEEKLTVDRDEVLVQNALFAGEAVSRDSIWFVRSPFRLYRRESRQERVRLDMEFEAYEAVGTLTAGEQARDFRVEVPTPSILSGGTVSALLPLLNLELGFQLEFPHFNVQQLNFEPALLTVDEQRELDGEVYLRVVIRSRSGNSTYWRQLNAPYLVVRLAAELPQFGDASITLTLEDWQQLP